MATLALSLAGQVVGGAIGGPIGATIGRALGALAGSAIDNAIFSEAPRQTGSDLRLHGSAEGLPIPRLHGWSRMSGNIIWATDLEEIAEEDAGAKGTSESEESGIAASFAIGLCEGEVHRLGRVWADGQVLDPASINIRFYRGSETQDADSLIEAKQGDDAPAYRGLCYLVFERLPLAPFGNRIPSISVELCRIVGDLEPAIRAVTVIPGASEYGYDPVARVRLLSPGVTISENAHQSANLSDWTVSLDELTALCPNLEHVSLVVAWFGDDLRCAECSVRPRVEAASRTVLDTQWSVAGLARGDAPVVSEHDRGPAYGGTPSDAAVRAAIADLTARGLSVTLYPILLMDIPAGNPMGQAAYPWRGRISCDEGDDGTGAAVSQLAAFADEYRDFILHYAELADDAGGVEAFVIGSELRGLTTTRGPGDSFPFVDALVDLAGDVRAIVGGGTKLTYAADWSEYSGHQPGGGAKFFHLDPLWASDEIDAVGIDNYMPAADWREGPGPYDPQYLRDNIEGGEGFDWYYASDADRLNGTRTPITDGAHDEPWIWRFKDLAGWWSNAHHNRPGGVRDAMPTDWVPASKPLWFTELGCAAIDRGANKPNVFLDPKSAESYAPHFSNGAPDALAQRQLLRAALEHWAGSPMVERIYLWTWDARPYPAFPQQVDVWRDGTNHPTGHWLTGRLGGAASDELMRAIAADYAVTFDTVAISPPYVHGYVVDAPMSLRQALEPLLAASGLGVWDSADGLRIGRANGADAWTIAELVADDGPLLTRRRPDAGEAAARVAVTYWDRERNYLAGSVTAIAGTDGALDAIAAGLVLDLGGARWAAERLLIERNSQREMVELTLPPSALALEMGDAIDLAGDHFEVSEIWDGLARRIAARALLSELEVAIVGDRPPAAGDRPVPPAVPEVAAAHLPPTADSPTITRLALGAFARPWPGRVLATDDDTGAPVSTLERTATMGVLTAPLTAGTMFTWDVVNTIEVELYSGHLASRDDAEVLAGANRIAVETDSGAWEMVGFAVADLIAPRMYRLSRLLRGQGGTDHAMGAAAAGNRVLHLDAKVATRLVDAAWLGATPDLRCYAGPGDGVGTIAEANIDLAAILPLTPVHLTAMLMPGGDIELGWVRRSRADSDSWATEDAPLDWAPEAYRLEIRDGPTLKRTIATTAPTTTYTLAQQTNDFGGAAAAFTWRVAQVSAVHGPGHWTQGDYDG
jgi:hypothetical protein